MWETTTHCSAVFGTTPHGGSNLGIYGAGVVKSADQPPVSGVIQWVMWHCHTKQEHSWSGEVSVGMRLNLFLSDHHSRYLPKAATQSKIEMRKFQTFNKDSCVKVSVQEHHQKKSPIKNVINYVICITWSCNCIVLFPTDNPFFYNSRYIS